MGVLLLEEWPWRHSLTEREQGLAWKEALLNGTRTVFKIGLQNISIIVKRRLKLNHLRLTFQENVHGIPGFERLSDDKDFRKQATHKPPVRTSISDPGGGRYTVEHHGCI